MFTQLGTWLTSFLTGYVNNVVAQLAAMLFPLAVILGTIYIANYGYAVARGEVSEPLGVFGWKMIKLAFIAAFALGGGLYLDQIATSISGLQDGMATIFISSAGGGAFGGATPTTAFGALDAANAQASALTADMWAAASLYRLDLYIAMVVFSFGMCTFLLVGGVVVLLSKMFMAFALAIGPAAILCLMFKPSAKYFDAWLSVALASAVLAWFVFFALGLGLYIVDQMAADITTNGAFNPSGTHTVSPISAAFSSLVMYVLLSIMLWQAPSLASALTGGPALRGGGGMAVSYLMGRSGGGGGGSGAGGGGGGGSLSNGAGAAYGAGRAAGTGAGMAWQRVSKMFNSR